MKVTIENGSVMIRKANGAAFEVREWFAQCDLSGHLKDGEVHRADDGCTWARHGAHVVVTEPATVAA